MEWFQHLPQEPGEYLWCCVDWGAWIVNCVGVVRLDSYPEKYKKELGKWESGKNGGSYLYKADDGTELVMCFELSAPYGSPGMPIVDAWCKFTEPPKEFFEPKGEKK